jgi:hypothetical protein
VKIRHRWRFGVVLVASLLLAVAQPIMSGLFDERGSFDVFFSLLIVAVLLLVFEEKAPESCVFAPDWPPSLVFGRATGLAAWPEGAPGRCTSGRGLFPAFALYGILRAILVKQVSGDAIFGAVVATSSWESSGVFYTPP